MAKTDRVRDALADVAEARPVPTDSQTEDATAGMVQVMFRFPEQQRDELRRLFAQDGLSLSAGIRSVLMRHLREQR